jgi:hypothetical protein
MGGRDALRPRARCPHSSSDPLDETILEHVVLGANLDQSGVALEFKPFWVIRTHPDPIS